MCAANFPGARYCISLWNKELSNGYIWICFNTFLVLYLYSKVSNLFEKQNVIFCSLPLPVLRCCFLFFLGLFPLRFYLVILQIIHFLSYSGYAYSPLCTYEGWQQLCMRSGGPTYRAGSSELCAGAGGPWAHVWKWHHSGSPPLIQPDSANSEGKPEAPVSGDSVPLEGFLLGRTHFWF